MRLSRVLILAAYLSMSHPQFLRDLIRSFLPCHLYLVHQYLKGLKNKHNSGLYLGGISG